MTFRSAHQPSHEPAASFHLLNNRLVTLACALLLPVVFAGAVHAQNAPAAEEQAPKKTVTEQALETLGVPVPQTQGAAKPDAQSADAAGEKKSRRVDPHYRSPRATVETFVNAMQSNLSGDEKVWRQAFGAMNFDLLPEIDDDDKRDYAEALFKVLVTVEPLKLSSFVSYEDVAESGRENQLYFPNRVDPDQFELIDRLGKPRGRIELVRQPDGRWQFSGRSVSTAPDLWQQLQARVGAKDDFKFTWSDYIESFLVNTLGVPRNFVYGSLFNIEYWKWLGLLVFIFAGLVLDQFVRFILRSIIVRKIRKRGGEIDEDQLKKSTRTFGLLAAAVFWLAMLMFINLEGVAITIVRGGLQIFVIATGVLAAWFIVDLFTSYLHQKAATTTTRLDDVLVPLVRKSLKIFITIMGVIYGANALNIPIGPLLASIGVASVAFSFAAKDTVENFFGSLAVLFDRPFDIGDWISANGVEGTVEEVGFRSTRIRTFYNSQVTMPNANLVRATVDNYGRRKYRRWREIIGVQYDTTPDQLVAFTEGIRELVRTYPYTRKDYFQVRVNSFGDSSYNILLYVFAQVDDWSMELRERERMILDIIRLADQLGVQFAFPTRTVHLFTEQAAPYAVKNELPARNTDRRAEIRGIRAAQAIVANQRWRDEKPGPVEFPEGPVTLDDEGRIDATEITEDTKPSQLSQEVTDTSVTAESEQGDVQPPAMFDDEAHPPKQDKPPKDDTDGTLRRS